MTDDRIAHWKSALLKLPDSGFFELMRNYLGELKTPYNKHSILEALEAFLRRKTTRERILALIDQEDALVLTAIFYTPTPSHKKIHRLLTDRFKFLPLMHKLRNLQDRLLIYLDRVEGEEVFYLNPLLQEELEERVIHLPLLLPSIPVSQVHPETPILNDTLWAAILSFVLHQEPSLKIDGSFRKQTESKIFSTFPRFLADKEGLYQILKALKRLGLVFQDEHTLKAHLSPWKEFSTLSPLDRILLILRAGKQSERELACREAHWLSGFLHSLSPERAYTHTALYRLALLNAFQEEEEPPIEESWILDLCAHGVFIQWGGTEYWVLNPSLLPRSTLWSGPKAILQPNFELSLTPQIDLSEALPLAIVCAVRRYDTYPLFELTKTSYFRGLALGLSALRVEQLFQRLTQQEVPQNVSVQLKSWETEYQSISFTEGILVQVDENRRATIEQHGRIKECIHLCIAPGVYLVRKEKFESFLRLLQEMGITVPPPLSEEMLSGFNDGTEASKLPPYLYFLPWNYPLASNRLKLPEKIPGASERKGVFMDSHLPPHPSPSPQGRPFLSLSTIQAELLDRLEALDLSDEQRKEWEQKILSKVVIDPDQIRPELKRRERTEAKGLDYAGKAIVIEQTISSPSDYVEILVRGQQGSPERYILRPQELRKTGTDLVVCGVTLPEGIKREIPIRKISLVRRIKGFLVG